MAPAAVLIASNPNPSYYYHHHHRQQHPSFSFHRNCLRMSMRPSIAPHRAQLTSSSSSSSSSSLLPSCTTSSTSHVEVAKQRLQMDSVAALASTLHNARTAEDIAQLLLGLGTPSPSLPLCISVIKQLGLAHRLDAAFALIEFCLLHHQSDTGSGTDTGTGTGNSHMLVSLYNALLTAVQLSKSYYRVTNVLDAMRSRGLKPDIVTYNTLISIRIQQGNPRDAFALLSDIEDAGLAPSPATYSILLSAYKHLDDAPGALNFFLQFREKYLSKQLEVNGDYNWDAEFLNIQQSTLRICLSFMRRRLVQEQENNTSEVLRFLACIDRADIKLDRRFLEPLVWACTREEHYALARELYTRLRESGHGPAGDLSVTVCNHIMWLMAKAKKWWAALEVYEEMLDRGPMPDNLSFELIVSNFGVLMVAAARRGLWRWALKLLDKMHEKGLTPTGKQWNAVLIACSKAAQTDTAVKIFQEMVKKGEKPTVHSYGALLSTLTKGKFYDEVVRVWVHMQKVGVKPNLYAYTILASMYAQKGDHDAVNSVLEEMVEAKIEPNVVTFNAIMSGCVKGRTGAATFDWFIKMKERNVKPDEISYETVIGALAQDGKPRLAYQMYVRAYNEGLVLNRKAYDTAVEACRVGGIGVDFDNLGFHPAAERRKPTQTKHNKSGVYRNPG